MKKQLIVTLSIAALAALAGCGKSDNAPSADASKPAANNNLADLASPAKQQQVAEQALPKGDANHAIADYRKIVSGNDVMFMYFGLSHMPVDYDQIAQSYSSDYRQASDSFKKNDILTALKPRIDGAIAAAKDSRYIMSGSEGYVINAYDFNKKGFPVVNMNENTIQFYNDNSQYALEYTNGNDFSVLKVDDEAKARAIEDMRSKLKPLSLRTYLFAQDVDPANRRVKFQIVHIQLVDQSGQVLAEM